MDHSEYMKKTYGLKSMSFEKEVDAPKNIKDVRAAKIGVIDAVKRMREYLDMIEYRAKEAPELDSESHAKLLNEWYSMVSGLATDADNVAYFGIH